VIVADFKKNF